MDPNTALWQARAAAAGILVDLDAEHATDPDDVQRLAESFQSLDEWLSKDGFLPDDWKADEDKTPAVTPRTGDMEMGEALSYAIFCINTFMHPDASEAADVDRLEAHSDEVVEALFELREIYKATKTT